ncbi:MAG: glycosyltransferase [Vampirovibrionales bacterium]
MPQKILLLSNLLGPFGGGEDVFLQTYQALVNAGCEVECFGTNKQPFFDTIQVTYQKQFPDYVDYDNAHSLLEKLALVKKPFTNPDAAKGLDAVLGAFKPDLIHMHSVFWNLTPSVLKACTKHGIPIVMTLHEARLICPAGTLMKGNDTYCDEAPCSRGNSLPAVMNRCYDGSLTKSMLVAAEFTFRRLTHSFDHVNYFVCPSEALAELVVSRYGIPKHQVLSISNPIENSWLDLPRPTELGKYFLFVGRLSKEKGVHTLLRAIHLVDPEMPLKIIGTGPEEDALKKLTLELDLPNVEFLGFKAKADIIPYYQNAIATVVPSEWFETYGMTIVESLACGRPVIASRTGGPKNIIEQSKAGHSFKMGDVNDLASLLSECYEFPEKALALADQAQSYVRYECNLKHYETRLMELYHQALNKEESPNHA